MLGYEYKNPGGDAAAFVANNGPAANVTLSNGQALQLPAMSISFVLNGKEIFNTNKVQTVGVKCNRTYTEFSPGGKWQMWPEPLPSISDHSTGMTRSPSPIEQLSLTDDRSDYLYYVTALPQSVWEAGTGFVSLNP